MSDSISWPFFQISAYPSAKQTVTEAWKKNWLLGSTIPQTSLSPPKMGRLVVCQWQRSKVVRMFVPIRHRPLQLCLAKKHQVGGGVLEGKSGELLEKHQMVLKQIAVVWCCLQFTFWKLVWACALQSFDCEASATYSICSCHLRLPAGCASCCCCCFIYNFTSSFPTPNPFFVGVSLSPT